MDAFLYHIPPLHLDDHEIMEYLSSTMRRRYFVSAEGTAAKLYVSGRVCARYQDPLLGDTVVLTSPNIDQIAKAHSAAIEAIQQSIYETLPESSENVLDYLHCVPLAAEANTTVLRIQIPMGKTAAMVECNNVPGVGYGNDMSPALEMGAFVRCVVHYTREEHGLGHCLAGQKPKAWKCAWILRANEICRLYSSSKDKEKRNVGCSDCPSDARVRDMDKGEPTDEDIEYMTGLTRD